MNFINMLKSNQLCSGQHCTVDNVQVTCGSEREKRDLEATFDRVRRGTTVHFIVFELTVKASSNSTLSTDQLAKSTTKALMDILKDIQKKGVFTVAGQRVSPLAVKNKTPVPVCEEGDVRARRSKSSCGKYELLLSQH